MAPLAAKQALERLKQGNERFQRDQIQGKGRDRKRRRELVRQQNPFAVILSCADSRVEPELAFDVGLGDLFVNRVAGNVANICTIASIEYAVARLETQLVVVLGHSNCGAVTAACAGSETGKNLRHLLALIQPAVNITPERDIDAVARCNARIQSIRLLSESDILREAAEEGSLKIVPAFYHLESGVVEFEGEGLPSLASATEVEAQD